MVDYVTIQHGDLDDASTITTLVGHPNLADYVSDGLYVDADFSTTPGTISVTEGKLFVLLDTQYAPGEARDNHDCLVTAHLEDRTGIDLVVDGLNYVWIDLNMGTRDSPKVVVNDTGDPPTAESLEIAQVDSVEETVTEVNRDPTGGYSVVTTDDLDVGQQVTWPDGTTTTGHALSSDEDLNNYNAYYDATETDPPGVVAKAEYALSADSAGTADSAATADHAADADLLEGNTTQDVIDQAADEVAQEWEILETKEWLDVGSRPDLTFSLSGHSYDRYRFVYQIDQYGGTLDENVLMRVNDIGDKVYRQSNSDYKRPWWNVGEGDLWNVSTGTVELVYPEPLTDNQLSGRAPNFVSYHHSNQTETYGSLSRTVDELRSIRLFFRDLSRKNYDIAMRIVMKGKNGL